MYRRQCEVCRVTIYMHDDSEHALEVLRKAFVEVGSGLVETKVYDIHICREADIQREERRQEQVTANLAQLARDRAEYRGKWLDTTLVIVTTDNYSMTNEERYRLALPSDCPKCSAPAGSLCEDLSARRSGAVRTTVTPHRDRIQAELRKRRAAARGDVRSQIASAQEARRPPAHKPPAPTAKDSLEVPCPRCHAPAGDMCWSLHSLHNDVRSPNRNVHHERVEEHRGQRRAKRELLGRQGERSNTS